MRSAPAATTLIFGALICSCGGPDFASDPSKWAIGAPEEGDSWTGLNDAVALVEEIREEGLLVQRVVRTGDRNLSFVDASELVVSVGTVSDGTTTVNHHALLPVMRSYDPDLYDELQSLKSEGHVARITQPSDWRADLANAIDKRPDDEAVHLAIAVLPLNEAELPPLHSVVAPMTLNTAGSMAADRQRRIVARRAFVDANHRSLVDWLRARSAQDINSLWLTNEVYAKTTKEVARALSAHPRVDSVEVVGGLTANSDWDGADVRHPDGLNIGTFVDAGFDGSSTRIAVIDHKLAFNHFAFRDWPRSTPRIVGAYDCEQQACPSFDASSPLSAAGHGTVVTALAAGDKYQVGFGGRVDPSAWPFQGPAIESEIVFLSHTSVAGFNRSIQKAVAEGVDVIISTWAAGTACDERLPSGMAAAIHAAVQADVLFVTSAGNVWGACALAGPAESPSAFVVGGLGNNGGTDNDCHQCDASNYDSCRHFRPTTPMGYGSSRGGMTARIAGRWYNSAVTGVDISVPACPKYTAAETHWELGCGCGTSWAAPLMGGAAAVVKDRLMARNSNVWSEGRRLFPALLAMADRQGEQAKENKWLRQSLGRRSFSGPPTRRLGRAWRLGRAESAR